MNEMILIYVVCESVKEARKIGKDLLEKKLCACVNILDKMASLYFWPPKSSKIEEGNETVLLIKTIKEKYSQINDEVKNFHSYDVPCIFSIKIDEVDSNYYDWLKSQVE